MKITEEQIKEVKKIHPDVYKAELSWRDEEAKLQELEILFRAPKVQDFEVYGNEAQRSPVVANKNLFVSLLVAPERELVLEKIGDKAGVILSFIENEVSPFFGSQIKTNRTKV